jgi:ATP-binding cassette subfamily B protein
MREPGSAPEAGETRPAEDTDEGPSFDLLQEQMIIAARQQPRDMRRLPTLVLTAIRLVWRTNRLSTFLTVLLQLSGAAVAAAQVLVAGYVMRELLAGGTDQLSTGLLVGLVVLAAVTALGALATAGVSQLGRLLGLEVERRVTDDVLDISTSVDLVEYDKPAFYDQLNRVLTTMPIQPYQVVTSVAALVGGLLGAIALLITLVAISPLLALFLALVGPPLWYLSRSGGALEFEFAVSQTANLRERTYLTELLTRRDGAAETRAYLTSPRLRERFAALYDDYIVNSRRVIARSYALKAASGGAMALGSAAALVALFVLVDHDRIDVAQAAAAVVAIRLLSGRLSQLFAGFGALFQAALFLDDFQAFRERHSAVPGPAEGSTLSPVPVRASGEMHADPPGLALRAVSFVYPNGRGNALTDVNLTIPPGQVVALVGENGSGKSTLAKLMVGLYVPTSGTVAWETVDGTALSPAAVRDRSTIVLQDFLRYQLSACDNITLGRPELEAQPSAVRAAADSAGIATLVESWPEGYLTRLSRQFAGGRELSSGQWQRVALARAFYRDGGLVVLDEPAAALDPRAEHRLYESVSSLLSGRTVVLITHRLRSVRGADRIIVLDGGRVVQDGDHETLIAQAGLYSELMKLQERGVLERDARRAD